MQFDWLKQKADVYKNTEKKGVKLYCMQCCKIYRRRDVDSVFSAVTMSRLAIIFLELGVSKTVHPNILIVKHFKTISFVYKLRLIATDYIKRIA